MLSYGQRRVHSISGDGYLGTSWVVGSQDRSQYLCAWWRDMGWNIIIIIFGILAFMNVIEAWQFNTSIGNVKTVQIVSALCLLVSSWVHHLTPCPGGLIYFYLMIGLRPLYLDFVFLTFFINASRLRPRLSLEKKKMLAGWILNEKNITISLYHRTNHLRDLKILFFNII